MNKTSNNLDNWSDEERGGSGDDEPDIQALLDLGYEDLDGFVDWLERQLQLDTRTAQQDCYNAESFVDYLANHRRKPASEANEYDLRWFVFSHYIRKSIADRETQERLPDSLLRFFQYLRQKHDIAVPDWVPAVLEDEQFYLQRLRAIQALSGEDEGDWKAGFHAWCAELEQDLDMRGLWLPEDMGEGMSWGERAGWREATLRDDANRLWQEERAELLADGLSVDAVRDRLTASYLVWLDSPQDRLEGATPRNTIRGERSETDMHEIEEDDIEDEN